MGVTWSKKYQVKSIPNISQYTDEEKAKAFYGPEDHQRIREDTAEATFLMKHGTKESDEVTYRGLEGKQEGECRRRRRDRYRVNLAVFQENDNQFDQGIHDPEAIADICQLLTQSSKAEALERAAQDAKDVGQQGAGLSFLMSDEFGEISDEESVNTMIESNLMTKLSERVRKLSRKQTNTSHLFPKTAHSTMTPSRGGDGKRGLVVLASIVVAQI